MIHLASLEKIKEGLDNCARPLFFFDGDADGLTSFLLLYKYKADGKGVMIGGKPSLSEKYVRRVEEYQPDAIFILDIAQIEQEFLDAVTTPIYWIDHHEPDHNSLEAKGEMYYFNPRCKDPTDDRPTAFWAYKLVEDWLWIAMIGIIGDYSFALADQMKEEYPDLLPSQVQNQGEALYSTKLGKLVRIINFNLKGSVSKAMTSVKILTRIETPQEILETLSPKGNYVMKRYQTVQKIYEQIYKQATEQIGEEECYFFLYENNKVSFSAELANELKYRHQDKVVVVGRQHNQRVIMSLRSETREIATALEKALQGLDAYGGGHPKACGAVVAQKDFEEFKKRFAKYCSENSQKD